MFKNLVLNIIFFVIAITCITETIIVVDKISLSTCANYCVERGMHICSRGLLSHSPYPAKFANFSCCWAHSLQNLFIVIFKSPLHLLLLLLSHSNFWGWLLLLLLAFTAVTGKGCHIEVVSAWSTDWSIYGMWAAYMLTTTTLVAHGLCSTVQNRSDLAYLLAHVVTIVAIPTKTC